MWQDYINKVSTGAEICCQLTWLAVERHIADLKNEALPFVFSEKHAEAAIGFVRLLRHTSGKYGGERFNLQSNQAFILAMLFGWRRKDNGKRRFTQAYLEVARKSGKSELAAAIELFCGFFEGEEGAQVYTAATTRDQANMVFRAAKKMARSLRKDSPLFAARCSVFAQCIVYNPTDSFIQKVSADAGTLDGLNPHCAVIDEYHAHKTDMVKGVMQTGMGSRDNPLLLIITTAGFDKDAPCFQVERRNAVGVLKGERKQENLFSIIFTLDEGDDWQDERVWRKANPNLGSTPTLEYLRDQVRDALNKGESTRVQVLTKNFNVWTDAPKVWIPDEVVRGVSRRVKLSEFAGREVYLGIDLAAVSDIAALAVYSPGDDDAPGLLTHFFFLPDETVKKRAADTEYLSWSENQHLIVTPGNITDYGFMKSKILEVAALARVGAVAYDQWNAYQFALELEGEGLKTVQCRQSFGNLSEPTKTLEKMMLNGEIWLNENPCLQWMFRNVFLDTDANDNIKPNKKRSGGKIDGVAASVMAIFAHLTSEPYAEAYNTESDLTLI